MKLKCGTPNEKKKSEPNRICQHGTIPHTNIIVSKIMFGVPNAICLESWDVIMCHSYIVQ